jgi:hypothetical protein
MSDSHKEALCRALSIIADTKPTEHAADQTPPLVAETLSPRWGQRTQLRREPSPDGLHAARQ